MRTLLDTGPLVGLIDRDDQHHEQCVQLFEELVGPLLLPTTVLIETCWMVNRYLGPQVQTDFLARAGDDYDLVDLIPDELPRMAQIVQTYSDARLDPTDASSSRWPNGSMYARSRHSIDVISQSYDRNT